MPPSTRHTVPLGAPESVAPETVNLATLDALAKPASVAPLSGTPFGEAHIRRALSGSLFEMYFQPVIDLRTGKTAGAEALARFTSRPYRSPDVWFGEADRCGLGLELELAAVRAALSHLHELPSDAYAAVNVAPRTLVSPELRELLAEVDGSRIVLELTEHARVDGYETLQRALSSFRARGFRLAIDDAGSGYSSLQHILQLRPDIIKLDRGLTTGVDTNPVRFALASALVTFGASLGARICAEGIETSSELVALQQLGIQFGQGYFLGRPAPLPLRPAPSGIWFLPSGLAGAERGPALAAPAPVASLTARVADDAFCASPAIRSASRLSSLYMSGVMNEDQDAELDRLTRLAARLLKAPVALVSLVDGDRQFFKSEVGLTEKGMRETPLSRSFCAHVVTQKMPLVIGDATKHPLVRTNGAVEQMGVMAYAGVPIITGDDEALGSFCVVDDKVRTWTADDLTTLHELATMASVRIDAQRSLLSLEKRANVNNAIIECADVGILVWDVDMKIRQVNAQFCALIGYEKEQLVGNPLSMLLLKSDAQRSYGMRDEFMSGRRTALSAAVRYRKPNDEPIWLQVEARLVRDRSGRPECFVVTARAPEESPPTKAER